MGFEPDDLDVINELVRVHPELNELLAAVKSVTDAMGFPIESRGELAEALARRRKDEESWRIGEGSGFLSTVMYDMPAFYFPIVSRKDLIAKLVEFRSQRFAGPQMADQRRAGQFAAGIAREAVRLIRPEDVKEGPLGPTDSPVRPEPMSAQLEWPSRR